MTQRQLGPPCHRFGAGYRLYCIATLDRRFQYLPRHSRAWGLVRLLQNQPGGLIHIMDDQARRTPKKTDHTMVEAFGKRWANHSSFKVGSVDRSGFPTFTINHFNGPVTYSSEGFLERNLDALNPDFVSLLRGSTQALRHNSSQERVRAPTIHSCAACSQVRQSPPKCTRVTRTRLWLRSSLSSPCARLPLDGRTQSDVPQLSAMSRRRIVKMTTRPPLR
jgi:hypothetical protein